MPDHHSLLPPALQRMPTGSIRPKGWLLDQCRIQASGLTGHLEEIWPDLGPRNLWLGGDLEGWERGPYYLDGLIPLAHILESDVLTTRYRRWIDSILARQSSDGWIGPMQAPGRRSYDCWPLFVVMKAFIQHYEATSDQRIMPAMLGFCRWLQKNLTEKPLFEWGRFRWADLALSIHWLFDQTGEQWLLQVAETVHSQGYDWRRHFEEFPYREKTSRDRCTLETHVVNSAMAIKAGAVRWRQSHEDRDRKSAYRALEVLDSYHGQATGVFSGDEHYAGTGPSQGTELCAVVEMMYSLETLCSVLGDVSFADRLERIAFNALPGAFTEDMRAHQYDQQVNQVLCTVAPRAWTNNADDSNIYGLEPNYG
ncbi:MAG TPA: beta-L-arabinofuranosidase domain-containing protein, partial [Chthonomonadales bacterium]|nr:beta-L-arabinofuranosidase domain-containing protein [Chthonomonadales bacterium]